MVNLKEVDEDKLRDPLTLYLDNPELIKQGKPFSLFKQECNEELNRRIYIEQEETRRRIQEEDKERKNLEKNVFNEIFNGASLLPNLDGSVLTWSYEVEDYNEKEDKIIKVKLKDIFRENFVWRWNDPIDPKKEKDRFLDDVFHSVNDHPICFTTKKPKMRESDPEKKRVVMILPQTMEQFPHEHKEHRLTLHRIYKK